GRLRGSSKPFDAATLTQLYGDEAGYLERFRLAAAAAVAAGVMLPRDVEPAVEEAAREQEPHRSYRVR
ncbi:MAG TPA: alpha/beta hydrolase domain-containing protein, partial [Phenylobacterium sp.]